MLASKSFQPLKVSYNTISSKHSLRKKHSLLLMAQKQVSSAPSFPFQWMLISQSFCFSGLAPVAHFSKVSNEQIEINH